jgi:hypothetical protein
MGERTGLKVICKHCGELIEKRMSRDAETADDWYWAHVWGLPQCDLKATPISDGK